MRHGGIILALACAVTSLSAQVKTEGPTCEKAQKTYNEGLGYLHQRAPGSALESFKKADKQDGGHCAACQQKMIKYGVELGDWKTAETAAGEMVAEAQGERM
jgi:Tfp pilus assembly protein PilF